MLAGMPYEHLFYHYRLAYSGWQYVQSIEGGESVVHPKNWTSKKPVSKDRRERLLEVEDRLLLSQKSSLLW